MPDEPTPREHKLKTLTPYWEAIKSGLKNFEVRRDDRGFQKGDILILECFDGRCYVPDHSANRYGFAAKTIRKRVTFVLTGGQFGVEPGYVVMGLEDA